MNYIQEFENLNNYLKTKDSILCSSDYLNKTKELLKVLEVTDGKLRDEIGWSTLSEYFSSELFSKERRIEILELLISDEYLLHDIDRGQTDSSVKRSFSCLAIGDLVWGDHDYGMTMDEAYLSRLTNRVITYLDQESDERGFDKNLGWVHGIAHSGDMFSALIMHPNISVDSIKSIFKSILNYLLKRDFKVFKWDEHFRLARPLGRAIARLDQSDVKKLLIDRFSEDFLYETMARQNLINTFRCLYIELQCNDFKSEYIYKWLKKILR